MRIVAVPAQRDDRRLDLLVHAGAQLEAPFLLELPAGSGLRDRLLRLAEAYGIRERLSFAPGSGDGSERIAVRLDGAHGASGGAAGKGDPTLDWEVESQVGSSTGRACADAGRAGPRLRGARREPRPRHDPVECPPSLSRESGSG